MKRFVLFFVAISLALCVQSESTSCGLVFNDTFDEAGALPSEWIEYNTSGRITVENGYMKFNHNSSKPSAYRSFTAVSNNCSFSFDVQGSRNSANCQIHLMSSTGSYLASFVMGQGGSATIKYATSISSSIPSGFTASSPAISFSTNTYYALSGYVDFDNQTVDFYCNGELMAGDVAFLQTAADVAKVDIELLYMYRNNGTFFFDNFSLIQAEEDRIALMDAVANAELVLSEASIGDELHQYPQTAADDYQLAIDAANVIKNNCESTSSTLVSSLADLHTASDIFSSFKNTPCGSVFYDTFDNVGTIPNQWIEYSTSGNVTVDNGYLKFDYNTTHPSAYRSFDAVTDNIFCSFDVQGSRSSANCQVDLISSDGEHIASIALGKSTTDIKYATSIGTYVAGVIGDDKFTTDTYFTVSVYIDFVSQTVDFYGDGVLTVSDVPFLETASNMSKIDIQLLYMYDNSGTFFFDNVNLLEIAQVRFELMNCVEISTDLLNEASIGDGYLEYSQSSVDAFQQVCDYASSVIDDCEALSVTVTSAFTNLEEAKAVFLSSLNNPLPLKLYSGYDFTGQMNEIHCGYYNGDLGNLEDTPISFKLEAGYMATFAQDADGLGFSKVYIAQDNDLEINLPEELQRSISFIRVSPWYPVGKKGSLGDVKWTSSDNYNTTWYYNWGLGDNSSAYTTPEVQFVPMSWSKADSWTSLEKMEALGQNMALNHHMAFNEPDNSSQSNLTVVQALAAYPKLLASGLRLGAPGVENIQYSANNNSFNEGAWIQEFMDSCVVRGYRVDFIPAHDYVRRGAATFLDRFEALHERYKIPVWVTEYNYGNPNMGSADITLEAGYDHVKSLTEALEGADFIERYNWYYFFDSSSGIGARTDGALNITGQFYRDLESQNPSYSQEEYVDGPYNIPTNLVEQDDLRSSITLYPNPVNGGVLSIIYSDISQPASVIVYDINGKELINIPNSPSEINVSHLENGFYTVKLKSDNSELVQRVIINN